MQGRYDMICPPHTAHALHQAWPGSTLRMVTAAGHALSEPGISAELVAIMDGLRGVGRGEVPLAAGAFPLGRSSLSVCILVNCVEGISPVARKWTTCTVLANRLSAEHCMRSD